MQSEGGWMKTSLARCCLCFILQLFLKALETMRTLVFGNLLWRRTVFPFFVPAGKAGRGTPEVLGSLYPSFSTSWGLGVAPAASALASRNWHWVHCLQLEAHGCGLKVHSWDQNAVWNTNSLCALARLFPWLPHPHQAWRTKLPPPARVSTCGLSFYWHTHTHTHTLTSVSFWWWGPRRYLRVTILSSWGKKSCTVKQNSKTNKVFRFLFMFLMVWPKASKNYKTTYWGQIISDWDWKVFANVKLNFSD